MGGGVVWSVDLFGWKADCSWSTEEKEKHFEPLYKPQSSFGSMSTLLSEIEGGVSVSDVLVQKNTKIP